MKTEYKALERLHIQWMAAVILGLAAELCGAILIFTGRRGVGFAVAIIGLIAWYTARFIGQRRYTAGCARMRIRYGLEFEDLKAAEADDMKNTQPWAELLPSDVTADRPMFVYSFRGKWNSTPTTLTEMTVGFHAESAQRQFLSGTLMTLEKPCKVPGLMVIYGRPYGGIPLSHWADKVQADTGDHGFLVLADKAAVIDENLLDILAAFDLKHKKNAVILTEAGRISIFLPRCFYSGTWTLFQRMPEAALSAYPLPELKGFFDLVQELP